VHNKFKTKEKHFQLHDEPEVLFILYSKKIGKDNRKIIGACP